ncbi:hypothetical protein CDAR_112371 [Caerostris darwini]|uniref:Uncharacterized protein n=1 Tax=Caerostris darwini TaxID=1538125 RepID=A0AAV4RPV4_9ARAC|nr:hypothetical protein CDAR_112371 [Caerostris darwini]
MVLFKKVLVLIFRFFHQDASVEMNKEMDIPHPFLLSSGETRLKFESNMASVSCMLDLACLQCEMAKAFDMYSNEKKKKTLKLSNKVAIFIDVFSTDSNENILLLSEKDSMNEV